MSKRNKNNNEPLNADSDTSNCEDAAPAMHERPDPEMSSRERGMKKAREEHEAGIKAFEEGHYGDHGPDTPEGELWRELISLSLRTAEVEPRLEDLRARASAGESLSNEDFGSLSLLGGVLPLTAKLKQTQRGRKDNYDAGHSSMAALMLEDAEQRADHAQYVRKLMMGHGGMKPETAQWVVDQWFIARIYFRAAKSASERIGVVASGFIYEKLLTEVVKDAVLAPSA